MVRMSKTGLSAAVVGAMLLAGGWAGAASPEDTGPVRIGILNDQSGPYAEFGGKGSVVAAQMAIDDFGGSVLGQKILLLNADHQNKADAGVAIARQWFDHDGVDLIADLTTSSVALAVQDLARERGKIDIVVGAATTRLTNESCSPTGFHWAFDTYALARGTAGALVGAGGKDWFFVTADYSFGHQMEKDTSDFVTAAGGRVLGSVDVPFNASSFTRPLQQAQASKAQIIGLANAGADTIRAVRQASELGVTQGGQKLAALLFTLSDAHALGLPVAQGLELTEAFYWDRDDASRAWSQRYFALTNRMPTMVQAGTYSAVLHYLKAVRAADTKNGKTVARMIRELPVDDVFAQGGKVRADGTMVHDMYLFEIKKPSESQKPWDYYRLIRTIPGDEAFQAQDQGSCPLVK